MRINKNIYIIILVSSLLYSCGAAEGFKLKKKSTIFLIPIVLTDLNKEEMWIFKCFNIYLKRNCPFRTL